MNFLGIVRRSESWKARVMPESKYSIGSALGSISPQSKNLNLKKLKIFDIIYM